MPGRRQALTTVLSGLLAAPMVVRGGRGVLMPVRPWLTPGEASWMEAGLTPYGAQFYLERGFTYEHGVWRKEIQFLVTPTFTMQVPPFRIEIEKALPSGRPY